MVAMKNWKIINIGKTVNILIHINKQNCITCKNTINLGGLMTWFIAMVVDKQELTWKTRIYQPNGKTVLCTLPQTLVAQTWSKVFCKILDTL